MVWAIIFLEIVNFLCADLLAKIWREYFSRSINLDCSRQNTPGLKIDRGRYQPKSFTDWSHDRTV